MNIGGSVLVLRRFQIDESGMSGANVLIEARQAGLVSFLLTLIGLDPNSTLKVTRGSISFRTSSVFGSSQVSTPLPNIGAFVGGYKKPFLALLLFVMCFSFAIVLFILSLIEGEGFAHWLLLVLSLIFLVFYYLNKVMFIGFETSGGGTHGFAFKASILEGVSVNISRVEATIDYVNSLISSAALGETIMETSKPLAIGGRSSTITQTTQPVVPTTPMPSSPPPQKPQAIVNRAPATPQQQFATNQAPVNQNKSRLVIYQNITQQGHNIGSFEEFNNKMNDEQSRWAFYSLATSSNMPIGTWDDFNSKMS